MCILQGPLIKDEKLKMRLAEVFDQVQNMMENFNVIGGKRRPGGGPQPPHPPPPAHMSTGQVPPGNFHHPHPQHHPVNLGQPPHLPPPPAQPQSDMLGFRNPPTAMQPHYSTGPNRSNQTPGQVFGPGGPQTHAGPMTLMGGPMGGAAALTAAAPPTTEEFLQSGDLTRVHVSKETEDEANSYFQKIYNQPQIKTETIKEFLDMLKRYAIY